MLRHVVTEPRDEDSVREGWQVLASFSAAAVEGTSEASCCLPRLMMVGRLAVPPRNASLPLARCGHGVVSAAPHTAQDIAIRLAPSQPADGYLLLLPLQLAASTSLP